MKKFAALLAIVLLVGGFFIFRHGGPKKTQAEELDASNAVPEVHEDVQSYTIQDGDTFTTAMEALGISYSEALAIVDAATDVFDFTTVKLGKEIRLVSVDGVRDRLEYEPNSEDIVTVSLTDGLYTTTDEPIPYETELATAYVTVQNSLYGSAIDAGVPEVLILEFADVFAWQVDFATQVHTGDSMEVLYEKRFRNGQEAGVGNVLAGRFTNVGETTTAYYFADSNGDEGYYDADGNSLIRPFLKAPIAYSRITSGYTTARFHPVTGTVMPHRAIDYAAPIGTPVMAVGDGTIVFAGWATGYGNFIKLKHNDTYETHYAHLSKFNVTVGQKVHQGDIIGYTGSTGWSTGPHLHYEVQVNGDLVNPLEVEFPKGDPIPDDQKDAFFAERDRLEGMF